MFVTEILIKKNRQMKNNFKKSVLVILVLFSLVVVSTNAVAQDKKMEWDEGQSNNSIVMTWNKNTPESEMNDDIKALKEHGVTVKYSNLKRNSANEITAIKVSFSDKNGDKGELNYEMNKAIPTITLTKSNDQVGFGASNNSTPFELADFGNNQIFKQFKFDNSDPKTEMFGFAFPDSAKILSQKKSRIVIKDPNKKQLIIENGEVIEGGEDYTSEELDKIKNDHKIEMDDENSTAIKGYFDLRDEEGMKDFKNQFQKLLPKSESVEEINAAKDELIKAREELTKAREELQKVNGTNNSKKSKL
jgi:hypothetical protein